jgi:CheY-like chemotaxis protein
MDDLRGIRSPRARILVVDDDAALRDLLTELLSSGGYDVLEHEGNELDIAAVVCARPDLIILDLVLNGRRGRRSGWDYLREIRATDELRAVPVLVCSGDVSELRARHAAIAADPTLYALEKPFRLDELERAIGDLVNGASLPTWDDERDLVLVADADSNLLDGSRAILRLLGISLGELRMRRVADIVAQRRAWTDREWRRYITDRRWSGEVTLQTGRGGKVPAHAVAEIVVAGSTVWHISRLTLRRS